LKSGFSLLGVFIASLAHRRLVDRERRELRYMTEKFAQTLYGVNTFQLRRRPMFRGQRAGLRVRAWRRAPRIKFSDAEAVTAALTNARRHGLAVGRQRLRSLRRQRKARDIQLVAASGGYFEIKNLRIGHGTALHRPGESLGRPCVGQSPGRRGGHSGCCVDRTPLGRSVRIGGISYRVVGGSKKQGSVLGLPARRSWRARLRARPEPREPAPVVDALLVKARSEVEMREAMEVAEGGHPQPPPPASQPGQQLAMLDYGPRQCMQVLGRNQPAFSSWSSRAWVIVSLVIGGIVIMNIMLMSVRGSGPARSGLRKSLGARRRDVLRQFPPKSAAIAHRPVPRSAIVAGIALTAADQTREPAPASVSPASVGGWASSWARASA